MPLRFKTLSILLDRQKAIIHVDFLKDLFTQRELPLHAESANH